MPFAKTDGFDTHLIVLRTRTSHRPDGSVYNTNTFSSDVLTSRLSRAWNVSPGKPYHATLEYEVRRHLSSPSPFYIRRSEHSTMPDWYWQDVGFYTAVGESASQMFLWGPDVSDMVATAVEDARNACFDNLRDITFNAPLFLAEFGKASDTVWKVAQAASKAGLAVYQGLRNPSAARRSMRKAFGKWARNTKGKNVSGDASSLWLEWRYSVETGLMDVSDASRTAADLLLDKSNQASSRVSATRQRIAELEPYVIADSAWGRDVGHGLSCGADALHVVTKTAHIEAKAWFTAVRDNSFLTDASQLGLLNVPLLAWELTPMSFVADWVLDVGNFLDRSLAGIGYKLLDGGTGCNRRVAGQHRMVLYANSGPIQEWSGEALYEVQYYYRDAWAYPTPTWTPRLRMNTKRWLDAAALLRAVPFGKFKAF